MTNPIARMNALIASEEKRLTDPRRNRHGYLTWQKMDSAVRARKIVEYLTGYRCALSK